MSTSKGYKVFIQTLPQQESVTVACICQTGEWKIYYENKERLRNALVEALTRDRSRQKKSSEAILQDQLRKHIRLSPAGLKLGAGGGEGTSWKSMLIHQVLPIVR